MGWWRQEIARGFGAWPAIVLLALTLLTGCSSESDCQNLLQREGDPAMLTLKSVPWTHAHGDRGLVGIPDASKTLVNLDGSFTTAGYHLFEKVGQERDIPRLFLRPGGVTRTWKVTAPTPGLPLVGLETSTGSCTWSARVYTEMLVGGPADIVELTVHNVGGGTADASLLLNGNLVDSCLRLDAGRLVAHGKVLAVVWPDDALELTEQPNGVQIDFEVSSSRKITIALPRDTPTSALKVDALPSVATLRAAFDSRWNAFFDKMGGISLPDPWLADTWRASAANIMLLRDRYDDLYLLKPGAHLYNRFWYRDTAYLVVALDLLGLAKEAEESTRVYWRGALPAVVNEQAAWGKKVEQYADGRWTAPDNEWDGPGQALWSLSMHHEYTRDDAWLKTVWPAARNAAEWLAKARLSTMTEANKGKAHYGLLPEGLGEAIVKWGYILYHDFWGVCGFRSAARMAAGLGDMKDQTRYEVELKEFSASVNNALKASWFSKDGQSWIGGSPGYPNRRIWGSIAALFPCNLLAADDPRMTATLETMWQRRKWDIYRFHDSPNKLWTYITADWGMALLARGEWQRAYTLFEGYRKVATPLNSWWEEYYIDSKYPTGDCPHGWAAGQYVTWLRGMLVFEDDRRLDLLRGVPPDWYVADKPIAATNLPTRLGLLQKLQVTTSADGKRVVEVQLKPHADIPPETISLRIFARGARKLSATCDGATTVDGDHIDIVGTTATCTLTP